MKQGKPFSVAFFLVLVKVTDMINTAQVSPHIKGVNADFKVTEE